MGLGSVLSVIACVGVDDETLDQRVGYFGGKLVFEPQEIYHCLIVWHKDCYSQGQISKSKHRIHE